MKITIDVDIDSLLTQIKSEQSVPVEKIKKVEAVIGALHVASDDNYYIGYNAGIDEALTVIENIILRDDDTLTK